MSLSSQNFSQIKANALAAVKAGNWPTVRAILSPLIRENVEDPDIWYWMGLCQANQQDHPTAVQSFKRSISIKPAHTTALDALGSALLYLGHLDDAIAAFHRSIKSNKKFSNAYAHLGNALYLVKKYQAAEKHLKQALKLNQSDHMSLYYLGLTYINTKKYSQAKSCLNKAIQINPKFGGTYNALGNMYQRQLQMEKAIECYKSAANHLYGNIELLVNLGLVLEKTHQLNEARDVCNKALEIDANHIGTNLLFSRLARRQNNYEEAKEKLQAILELTTDNHNKYSIYKELGHVLDKLGQYDDAFDAFTTANNINIGILESLKLNPDDFLLTISNHQKTFTSEVINATHSSMIDDKLSSPIFLVGFPRSGTTLMEQILVTLPNIMGSREEPILYHLISNLSSTLKRPFQYPIDVPDLSAKEILLIRKEYWKIANDLMGKQIKKQRLLDKLPLNIVDLGFINYIFPESKIIVAIRDPRDVCLSCFMQTFELNMAMSNFLTLESTTKAYKSVMQLWLYYRSTLSLSMIDYRYEDLVANLPVISKEVISFIGENWTEDVLNYNETAKNKYANTPSYQAVTQPIYNSAVRRWKNYEKEITPYVADLSPIIEFYKYS